MNPDTLRDGLHRLLQAPDSLTDADIDTLGTTLGAPWRDRALERRAAARQAAAMPPKDNAAAMAHRIGAMVRDVADLVVGQTVQNTVLRAAVDSMAVTVATHTATCASLQSRVLDLEATRAAATVEETSDAAD